MPRIYTASDAEPILRDVFDGCENERFCLLCLGGDGTYLDLITLSEGARDRVGADLRETARAALRRGASGVILAHNHPDGKARPSYEDMRFTRALTEALARVGVDVKDHILYVNGRTVSLAGYLL